MRSFLFSIFLLFFSVSGWAQASSHRVGVSVLPLENIVREIAGETVPVLSLQREGDSCSVFEPRPSSIAWLSRAKVFFRTGVGYESVIIPKLQSQFPEMKIVDLREVLELNGVGGHDHTHHGHGDHCLAGDGEDSLDPHFWLDPVLLSEVADRIAAEVSLLYPDLKTEIEGRTAIFKERALSVHHSLKERLAPYAGRAFYIYHPALGYFADRYDLEQVAIAGASDSPAIRELHSHIARARRDGIKTIFVQPQESRRHAEILASAINARVVEIDPMASAWENNLLQIGESLAGAFASE